VESIQLSSMVCEAIVAAQMEAIQSGVNPSKISLADIRSKFRTVIEGRLKSGEMRNLGATKKDAIDAYQKRLVRFHDFTIANHISGPITVAWNFRHLTDVC
jgi:hypothetical protein